MKHATILALALSCVGCGTGTPAATARVADAMTERLIFRCTLEQDNRSFSITEKGGKVSLSGSPYKTLRVTKETFGGSRTWIFEGANTIDGVPHSLAVTVASGQDKDTVSTDGDVFSCKWKATINSAVLDSLVTNSQTDGERAVGDVLAQAETLGLCAEEGRNPDLGYGRSLFQERLAADTWLVQIHCFLGAYQGGYQLVKINTRTKAAKVLKAQSFDGESGTVTVSDMLFGIPDYQGGSLTNFAKGRGLGDCGRLEKFEPLAGDVLKLREVRAKDECDGVFVAPSEWPLVFPRR